MARRRRALPNLITGTVFIIVSDERTPVPRRSTVLLTVSAYLGRPRRAGVLIGVAVFVSLVASGCATTSPKAASASSGSSTVVNVVAAENFWGSLAAQLGGAHVKVISIINSPDADPHDYEPTAVDGRAVAGAKLVVVNGIGYDPWAGKLV